MLKISIITVCYNSERFIEAAIQSVLKQTYNNIEYIIIDGGSTDRTLSIIGKYKNRISLLISEPDKGIYDAMNKGILNATGEVIGFLNSDDFYADDNALVKVIEKFEMQSVDCVFGNINYVKADEPTKIVRKWESGEYKKNAFKKGWHPAHPTFFVRKHIYNLHGIFNLEFSLAADFELMLRFLEKFEISNYYLNLPLIHMRLGGATSGSLKNIRKQNIECYRAFAVNNLKVSILYTFYRILPKLKQFLN